METTERYGELGWMPLTLHTASFLRFILSDYGYGLSEGAVIVADSERQARNFLLDYCNKTGNARQIDKWNSRSKKLDNYYSGLMILKRGLREMDVENYLAQSEFFPILVTGGILPEFLKVDRFILRLNKKDIIDMRNESLATTLLSFRRYIKENTGEVCETLQRMRARGILPDYEGADDMKIYFSMFAAIASVYCNFLRKNQGENKVYEFYSAYMEEAKDRIEKMGEFACGMDASEIFSQCIWDYVKSSQGAICVGDISNINGELYEAFTKNAAIFYDFDFYYMPPELFRVICTPLLQSVSEPELKRQLKEADILYCNSADYTVKKKFTTVFGNVTRPRMIWIRKDSLFFPDNLFLEDLF